MTKIMLVEDDNNLREIYEARLAAEGFDIVSAQDGEAALAIASKEKPDIIISDVMMPKISGFEMLDILRNTDSLKNTKIIMLTALSQAEDSQRASTLGADRYLVKSQVTLEDIVKAAHELIGDQPAENANESPAETEIATTIEATAAVSAEPASEVPVATAPEPTAAPSIADAIVHPEPAVEAAPVAEAPATENTVVPAPEQIITPDPAVSAPEVTTEPVTPADNAPTEPTLVVPEGLVMPDSPAAESPADATPETTPTVPAVTSIPVSDASDSTDSLAGQQTAPTAPTASPLQITVVEPPADDAVMPVADPSANATSQSTTQQQGPTDEAVVSDPSPLDVEASEQNIADAAPQNAASEEEAMRSQIDDFINQQVESQTAVPVTEPAAETSTDASTDQGDSASQPEAFVQTDVAAAPAIEPEAASVVTPEESTESASTSAVEPEASALAIPEKPATTSQPVITSDSLPTPPPAPVSVAATREATDVDFEPVAESLGVNQAPIITPANGAAAPEPQPVPTPTIAKTSTETAEQDSSNPAVADTVKPVVTPDPAEALNDLASGQAVAEPTQSASTGSAKKIITPPDNSDKPTIHQLLAVEEAKAGATQAAASIPPAATPNIDAYSGTGAITTDTPAPSTSDSTLDPNSISL